ncbi:hypothetical protein D3C71_1353750 [compost metagenome]
MFFLQPAVPQEHAGVAAFGLRDQRGAAHGHHGFGHQCNVARLGQMRPPGSHVQEGQIDVLAFPGGVLAGVQVDLHADVGMQLDEAPDARRQPQRGQRGVGRHVQRVAAAAPRGGADVAARRLQKGQGLLYRSQQLGARFGGFGAAHRAAPAQQLHAQVCLQRA